MPSKQDVTDILNEVADLLEIKGVEYKPRAYRRAAREIDSLTKDLEEIRSSDGLEAIPSVGENIAAKVGEILDDGKLGYLEELKREIPVESVLLQVRNLGPKKVKKIWQELDVTSLEELEEVLENGEIRNVKGFGQKSEENIRKGLEIVKQSRGKSHLSQVLPVARDLRKEFVESDLFDRLSFAGSLRRRKYEVGDLDILASAGDPGKAMEYFGSLGSVEEVLSKGETKSSIRTEGGLRVDLRIVPESSFGAAMQYFTGSQQHNVRLRQLAISQGYKLNEYGLLDEDTEEKVAGEEEEEVYKKLGLDWITPELREDRGEIRAAEYGDLPDLVTKDDIRGDLHCHSARSSDAHAPLEELVQEARDRGYNYLAITDHAETSGIVGGLSDENISDHLRQVEQVEADLTGLKLLAGVEANIQEDGTLDLTDDSLDRLDLVVAGIHSLFDLPKKEMTRRIIRALRHDQVDILAHPTGRKLGERGSFDLNWEEVFRVAKETETALEINASPSRSDLDDKIIKRAIEKDVLLSIGTDSHRLKHLDFMELGIYLARRGWCEMDDLLNTLSYPELKSWLEE